MTAMGTSTGVGHAGPATAAGAPAPHARSQAVGRMLHAVRSSGKAMAGTVIFTIFVVVALIPGVIARDDPRATIYPRSAGPSLHHLFGTTAYGQDLFAQTVWSTRDSLLIALAVGVLTTVLAVLIGAAAAYLGGVSDGVLSLVTDLLLVIPLFPLLIVIAAYARNGGTLVLIIVLTLTEWSYGARQLRAQALSMRNRDFLEAARVRGERSLYIIVVEIIPTMTSLIVAVFLSSALYALLFASSLQFIGLGDPNSLSWGTMLYWAQNNEALQTGQYLWAVAPGACIAALGASFALLNYAFDEIGNPALRPVRRIRVKHAH
jgi:peptide/nickel transport system permease protein